MWNEFIKQFFTLKGYENVLKGVWATAQIAVFGLLIGSSSGPLIAVVRVMPKYKLLPRILDKICVCYIELFRGTPMVVQLLIGYWVLLPALGITVDSGVPVAVVVFGLNSGAYVSEIMRGGINSVDKGQMEAGRAVGLTYATTMLRIAASTTAPKPRKVFSLNTFTVRRSSIRPVKKPMARPKNRKNSFSSPTNTLKKPWQQAPPQMV